MDDLLQEFISETRETLEALSGEIVAWEADPTDRARLDAIFRFVHTVKGSCGFLDLPRLARLSHAAEDVLSAVRSGTRTPDPALVDAVLAIVDRIGELVEAIDAGAALDDSREDCLVAALTVGGAPATPAVAAPVPRTPTRSVRLNVDLLDRMMSGMSDMVLARNELARRLRDEGGDPKIEAALERLTLTVAEMRDTVTRTRMQKIDALFSALPRMVRDTAAELGKSVTLHVEGADVELDREMIEMMRDPLIHIVRNSIDHGIEAPAARRAAGKSENGRLAVSARQSGNRIVIEITDDGRGIDVDAMIARAATPMRPEHELRALSDKAKLDLIFEPGLSTKSEVTAISGRGVGMDVVRTNIEQIGGRIELLNTPGAGLTIVIHVPLTLSIIATIGVGVGGQRFAIPRPVIEEIVAVRGKAIRIDMIGDAATATVRGRRLPLVDLRTIMGMPPAEPANLVIAAIAGGCFAIAVDSVLDHEELVIKPAAPVVTAAGIYAGETLPDTGLPMLLLDCAGIAAVAGLHFSRVAVVEDDRSAVVAQAADALLFDDLDGVRRLVPLAVVDRIEQASSDAIRYAGGAWRLAVEGRIIPLTARAPLDDRPAVAILRLRDGDMELAYAIAAAHDIVPLPDALVPVHLPGPVAGVVLLADEQVELLDVHWLFANEGVRAPDAARRLCLIDDSNTGATAGWIATFLGPVLGAAGYRVATRLARGEQADVVLTMAAATGDAATSGASHAGVPVVRLRSEASGAADTVYRYDRDEVIAALERSVGRIGR